MQEQGAQTQAPGADLVTDKEVSEMYRAFKAEHPAAKITEDQFRQVLVMRRREVLAGKVQTDLSKTKINDDVLAVKPSEVTETANKEAARLSDARQKRDAAASHTLARLLAQLHGCLPPPQKATLVASTKGALKDHPPTVSMPDLANTVVEMCRDHGPDSEEGLDLEIGFREWFAAALDVPAESFASMEGGIPRKIFARMMSQRRSKELAREKELKSQGLGDNDDTTADRMTSRMERVAEEEEEAMGIDHAPSNGFGGVKGDYMRERLMQIPAEKRDKMLRGMQI